MGWDGMGLAAFESREEGRSEGMVRGEGGVLVYTLTALNALKPCSKISETFDLDFD